MEKTATKRSVIGNAAVIVTRRKALGLNQDGLAEKAGYSRRVIQKLEAGEPVAIETLDNVATALGMTYKEVLVADENVQDESKPDLLVFKINLGDMKDPVFVEKVRTLISALQQLLPDQTGICILAIAGGILTVGVTKTAASEASLANPTLKDNLRQMGIIDFAPVDVPSRKVFAPATIRLLGHNEDHDYMFAHKSAYEAWQYALMKDGKPTTPWDTLTERQKLEYCILCVEEFLASAEGNNPYDWPLIRGRSWLRRYLNRRIGPWLSPQQLHEFAKAEMAEIGEGDSERRSQLWHLAHFSTNRDKLLQLRAILTKLDG